MCIFDEGGKSTNANERGKGDLSGLRVGGPTKGVP